MKDKFKNENYVGVINFLLREFGGPDRLKFQCNCFKVGSIFSLKLVGLSNLSLCSVIQGELSQKKLSTINAQTFDISTVPTAMVLLLYQLCCN